jgi:Class II flagellar assembly regulator
LSETDLRIEGNSRTSGVGAKSAAGRSSGTGGLFQLESGAAPARANAASAPVAASTIDALLALQAVEDPLFAKKKAIRRGQSLLDVLDEVKTDLLLGRVSEGRLNQLMALVTQAREKSLPGLDALIDDIELRARVELAKLGRYPGM